jgi:hypothetical protein
MEHGKIAFTSQHNSNANTNTKAIYQGQILRPIPIATTMSISSLGISSIRKVSTDKF